MQAKDLDDREVLAAIDVLCRASGAWTFTSAVAAVFPAAPQKVVAAKLSKLLRRGLVTGCDCGCRGDWELTPAGRDLIGLS